MTDATTITSLHNSPRASEPGAFCVQQLKQQETTTMETAASPGRRYASRKEAMAYMRVGSTKMNELMQSQAIIAMKDGVKVIIDLDSVDSYRETLPRIGARQ
jgi:hypothetical protein